jgi:hypothetical protein
LEDSIAQLKGNKPGAVFSMNLSLECVLAKSMFCGVQKGLCVMDVEKVYNALTFIVINANLVYI